MHLYADILLVFEAIHAATVLTQRTKNVGRIFYFTNINAYYTFYNPFSVITINYFLHWNEYL